MHLTKMRPNKWLVTNDFLNKSNAISLDFFKELCYNIYKFINFSPSPIITYWNILDQAFQLSISSETLSIPYNHNMSIYEHLFLIRYWAYKYFPTYKVSLSRDKELTATEIVKNIDKIDLNSDIFNPFIKESYEEVGIIENIFKIEDQLKIRINGNCSIRLTKIPVSFFIKNFRKIKDNDEKRNYLLNNTKEIFIGENKKLIDINYENEMLKNFFKVQIASNYDNEFKQIKNLSYKWGYFLVNLSNKSQIDFYLKAKIIFEEEYEKNMDIYLYKAFNLKTWSNKNE